MRWSWNVGRLFGIEITIHATFWLLVGWFALGAWIQERSVAAVVASGGFILALFACVLLHELGHALMARRFGIPTRDITLLPIGGVARLERMPSEPRQELWVSLAGPAVNVVIAGLIFAGLWLGRSLPSLETAGVMQGSFWGRLMLVNVLLVAFNLLPAFPMDGGRVLRALLAMRTDEVRATSVAASVGRAMALLFALLGLVANPFLLLIALFVWMGAGQEASVVRARGALRSLAVWRAMQSDLHTLEHDTPLARAWEVAVRSGQEFLPVLDDGRFYGLLDRERLAAGLAEDRQAPAGAWARRDPAVASPFDTLDSLYMRMLESGSPVAAVIQGGRLTGLVTMAVLRDVLRVQESAAREETSGQDAAVPPRAGLASPLANRVP